MRVLIFGGNGMLGHKLIQILQKDYDVWATVRNSATELSRLETKKSNQVLNNVNVEEFTSIQKAIELAEPDVIINAVGIIKQQPNANNVIDTLKVNSIFPHQLAKIARSIKARLITISTDCVFNGKKGNYDEDDVSDAVDLYGKSKSLGEISEPDCLTLRTSIIGRELNSSHSLVEWFLSNYGKSVKGFSNAIYSGFPTIVFSNLIADLIENHQNLQGIYNVSSQPINKYDLLCLVNKYYRAEIEIEPDPTLKIDRSLNSEKFRRETGFTPLDWDEMIRLMAEDNTVYNDFRK